MVVQQKEPVPVLDLFEAARAAGLSFSKEVEPQDKFITLGNLKIHYLDWGS